MFHRISLVAGLAVALMLSWSVRGVAQEPPPPAAEFEDLRPQIESAEEPVALNRGPIHEAFAEPYTLDPEPGLIVAQQPPDPIEEIPPDIRPEDPGTVWFPGYWGWDAELEMYVWVSGTWRKPPPYHRWLPGYWHEVDEGWQWVPGTWVAAEQQELEYLPEPPQSLEAGPNSEPPSEQHVWIPGCWLWQEQQYAWRPGYWTMGHDRWVWMPHRYLWTPYGCVFVRGYWDYPFARRGWLFAPYFFPYHRPGFLFSPFTPFAYVYPGYLWDNFWIWPGYRHYFFGNYFGLVGRHPGFHPWHHFHGSRRGYDPLFWHRGRSYRGGVTAYRNYAQERFDRFERSPRERPPATMRDLERFRGQAARETWERNTYTRQLQEGLQRGELGRVQRLNDGQRRTMAEARGRMDQFAGQRRQLESQAARALAEPQRRGPRPESFGLPSARMTEQREVRRSPYTQPGVGRRQEVRRPDLTRPELRRPDTFQPGGRRPDVRRLEPGRGPAVGPRSEGPFRGPDIRGPDIRRSPGPTRPATPQFRGGSPGPRPSSPQIRGGGGGGSRPSPGIRGGGGGGRPSPGIRGGGGGRGGSGPMGGGRGSGGGRGGGGGGPGGGRGGGRG
jgi:hypothetical protein